MARSTMPRRCWAWLTEMQAVLHITPQVPPAICGVGDYAAVVGRRMEELCPEVRCCYLAAGHRAAGVGATRDVAKFWDAVEEMAEEPSPSPSLGGRGIAEAAIVLHYSGYGYDPSGTPAWLAEALERRPSRLTGVRVVTFFHELYATGKPWQRAFWTSSRQRAAAIRVARASDALMTNREQSARWLERQVGLQEGSVPHLPVCSNVGEPTELIPWEERAKRAVTFGAAVFKRFALRDDAERVATMLGRLGIVELVDIGESTAIATEAFARHGVRVEATGRLPAAGVSEILGGSRVGLLDYSPAYLDKSGVYAAFAAHGLACLMPDTGFDARAESRFVSLARDVTNDELDRIAAHALRAYRNHSSSAHANLITNILSMHPSGAFVAVRSSP